MSKDQSGEQYDDAEAARRRDEVIKRMLNTPPQPRQRKPAGEAAKERKDQTTPRPKPRS